MLHQIKAPQFYTKTVLNPPVNGKINRLFKAFVRFPRTFQDKGALAWYGKLTWESAHTWILKILCYLIVWGITLIFMVRLSFYAIPLLIYDVMNDITIIP